MIYVLNIVVFFEVFEQQVHLFNLVFICQGGVGCWNLFYFCGEHMITLFGHAVPQGWQNRRVTADFYHIVFDREVVCIKCEAVFHNGIFIQTGVFLNDHALFG